ncbi:MAG: hypothetical protein KDA87_26180, partial [Planctomycetales bacterium]|nr:hypothetical protein [Planctomycetales bacterium]
MSEQNSWSEETSGIEAIASTALKVPVLCGATHRPISRAKSSEYALFESNLLAGFQRSYHVQ